MCFDAKFAKVVGRTLLVCHSEFSRRDENLEWPAARGRGRPGQLATALSLLTNVGVSIVVLSKLPCKEQEVDDDVLLLVQPKRYAGSLQHEVTVSSTKIYDVSR